MPADIDMSPRGVQVSLWRALSLFRAGAAALALAIIVRSDDSYRRPGLGLVVGAAIAAWTVVAAIIAGRGRANRVAFVLADVAVAAALTFLTMPVQTYDQSHGYAATLTTSWGAAPGLGAGILAGWGAGLAAALVQGGALLIVRQGYDGATLANVVLLVLAATSIGYVSRLAVRAERDLTRASAERAAGQERERLARSIHDGVLQVLALVQRRGSELGGGAAELGRLAGDQEAALRALITSTARPAAAGVTDLAASLAAVRSAAVTVSLPAEPVLVDSERAGELLAAVGAALENVRRHAGPDARTWVLLEALGGEVVVTVRDDGTGIPAGRIEEAAAQGRLGISMSIRGRMDALGGTATVTAEAGEGTEVELRAPMR